MYSIFILNKTKQEKYDVLVLKLWDKIYKGTKFTFLTC